MTSILFVMLDMVLVFYSNPFLKNEISSDNLADTLG